MYAERLVCIAVTNEYIVRVTKLNRKEVAVRSYPGKLTASDYRTVFIDNTDNTTDSISHLMNYALK